MAEKLTPHEALVLDALYHCDGPVDLTTLHELADPRDKTLNFGDVVQVMDTLLKAQLVAPITGQGDVERTYCITNLGRARLVASEARKVFGERVVNNCRCAAPAAEDAAPIRATCCHPATADRRVEPELPSTALICLDEDELDDWWESLDVEQKADAFSQFSLRMYSGEDSHIYIEPTRPVGVPILGTVGETAEEWEATAERLRTSFDPNVCTYCGDKRSTPWASRQSGPNLIRASCAKCRPLFDADNKADDSTEAAHKACLEQQELHGEQGYYE